MALEYTCSVGSLSSDTNDQSLERAFRRFGHIVEAKVTSRGCGHVTFSTESAMNAAVNGMDGQNLDGKNITVSTLVMGSGGGGHRIN